MDVIINKKKVGEVQVLNKQLTYLTHRDSQAHFFRVLGGYGISESILRELEKKGVNRVLLIEHRKDGSKHSFESEVSQFLQQPIIQEENYDKQRILKLSSMREL